jgi:hypothetical protein
LFRKLVAIPAAWSSVLIQVLGFKYSADYIIIVIDRILEEYFPSLSKFLFYYNVENVTGDDYGMEVVAGTIFKMEQCIRAKLRAAGATSREKAVTIQEANFDMQEQNWLNYIAGGLFAAVKKTEDKRYYIAS